MNNLLGKTKIELKEICKELGLASYSSLQICQWLYQKKVATIDEMTNLSKSTRSILKEHYQVGRVKYTHKVESVDGTKKYLFPAQHSSVEIGIEAVMIPDRDRATICVSTQAGCKNACKFCMTGRQGFNGNLTATEIISQFIEIDEGSILTNAVFMGMGEPLDNYDELMKSIEILTASWGFAWSSKRITVSSIGIIPNMKRFLQECGCHLAISLHNPYHEERLEMMPIEKKYPISEIVSVLRQYDFSGQRRLSFEYIMFNGVNDDKRHADGLIRLLKGLKCRMNLIRFHKIPDLDLDTTPLAKIELFKKRLNDAGLLTTIRASRGEDVFAACGMLAGTNKKEI
ncbi:MAG: 23S rRNA (adenine(2503)-C(2))-methyltransferase RlmN [Bacteroidales bacterium]